MNNIQIRPIPHMLKYRKNQFNSKKEVQEKPNPNGLHREAVNLNKFPKFVVPPLIRPSAAAAVRARGHASQGGPSPGAPARGGQVNGRRGPGVARTSRRRKVAQGSRQRPPRPPSTTQSPPYLVPEDTVNELQPRTRTSARSLSADGMNNLNR